MVGARGFERPTSPSQTIGAAKLQVSAFLKVAATKDFWTWIPARDRPTPIAVLPTTLEVESAVEPTADVVLPTTLPTVEVAELQDANPRAEGKAGGTCSALLSGQAAFVLAIATHFHHV